MRMPLFETIRQPCGPAICVHFNLVNNQIHKINLTLHERKGIEWRFYGDFAQNKKIQSHIHDWMESYLIHQPSTLPDLFFLPTTTIFQRKVWKFLTTLSIGQLASYGEVAKAVASPGAARAVGTVCARNNFPLLIPCHRVIGSKSSLGGFSCGLEIKKRLLEFEQSWHQIRNQYVETLTEAL
ncbi:MGMT family protein [Parachlamydia sp. AcF125]|uniref:methylated-DNA--[protein]-cysteine S-methyltransferase n=1 Tax=Parachlamydia sp. AcF125 TaxID=2795736 RepID=UPI001BC9264E|nr:MGMT family protein [Parachlamydia sp. AcF125]MBS4168623.1 Methylated-DNA--protein-cysteine methyltransferase [Parachlamydia sp. AcF125]